MDKKRRVSCDSLFSGLERAGVDTKSDSVIETILDDQVLTADKCQCCSHHTDFVVEPFDYF